MKDPQFKKLPSLNDFQECPWEDFYRASWDVIEHNYRMMEDTFHQLKTEVRDELEKIRSK